MRKPAEGVWNIVRFNWHFYAAAGAAVLALVVAAYFLPAGWQLYAWIGVAAVLGPTVVSLAASWYVYDLSGLYSLKWLPAPELPAAQIVNIHAGFDETSGLLRQRFPQAALRVLDFYDPALHTEVSIRRARAACPPYPGTEAVLPHALPLASGSTDWAFVLLAAHEIRQPEQRIAFFQELRRALRPQGRVVVLEHLRDPANFLAYTIGFLHFYSRASWRNVFSSAGLHVQQEQKITPFLSAFTLLSDGNPA